MIKTPSRRVIFVVTASILVLGLFVHSGSLAGTASFGRTSGEQPAARSGMAKYAVEERATEREICRRRGMCTLSCGNRRDISSPPDGTLNGPGRHLKCRRW